MVCDFKSRNFWSSSGVSLVSFPSSLVDPPLPEPEVSFGSRRWKAARFCSELIGGEGEGAKGSCGLLTSVMSKGQVSWLSLAKLSSALPREKTQTKGWEMSILKALLALVWDEFWWRKENVISINYHFARWQTKQFSWWARVTGKRGCSNTDVFLGNFFLRFLLFDPWIFLMRFCVCTFKTNNIGITTVCFATTYALHKNLIACLVWEPWAAKGQLQLLE